VPVLRSFAVQLSCDLELHGLVGGTQIEFHSMCLEPSRLSKCCDQKIPAPD
jgi:hypothetical protein